MEQESLLHIYYVSILYDCADFHGTNEHVCGNAVGEVWLRNNDGAVLVLLA